LGELREADYNPRQIKDKNFKGLKYSLTEFGDISGIVFNSRTGNLVCGHQRVRALREEFGDLEITAEKVVTPAGEFRIRIVDWDPDKERAANIAGNAETLQGEWTEAARLLIEEVRLNAPDAFSSLQLQDLNLSVVEETIPIEGQSSDVSIQQRMKLRFGEHEVYMTDDELNGLIDTYERYVEKHRVNSGFVTYLIEGK
ncbi:MAG: hypothetical protein EDM75_10520, partial [Chlorobiota bacterium]